MDEARIVTVPNALSVLRLAGVPVFCWLALGPEADLAAVIVLMASGFTDWLDGKLARVLHQQSRVGELLDPLVDRLYILATLVVLSIRDILPWWLAVAIVFRDVLLTGVLALLRRHGYGPPPVHVLGKAATMCMLYAFPLLLLGDGSGTGQTVARVIGWAFAIWGTALYWWAGALYAVQARRLLRNDENDGAMPDVQRLSESPAAPADIASTG